jgi:hypothetical protein
MRAHLAVNATPVVLDLTGYLAPLHVGVTPGAGSSLSVEYSLTDKAGVNPSSATWFPWSPGTVSSPAVSIIGGAVTALRVTRASGSSQSLVDVVTN